MIDYLTEKVKTPLSSDEKLELALLLEKQRKLYYNPMLLETMVNFVKEFDFKPKEERRKFIIEYVKIKERVETACFLRDQLNYDQQTRDILDKYSTKENINS
jgi:hypothetical protein